jgi:hypothetical protein
VHFFVRHVPVAIHVEEDKGLQVDGAALFQLAIFVFFEFPVFFSQFINLCLFCWICAALRCRCYDVVNVGAAGVVIL